MLFRKQAVEAQQSRLYGRVMIATPVRFWIITGFLSSCIAVLIAFLTTASFARIESVRGAVMPSNGIVQVHALNGGILTDFSVQEGDHVNQGQVVGTVTASSASDEDGTRAAAELARIVSEISLIEALIDQNSNVAALELAANARERMELSSQVDSTEKMLTFQRDLLTEIERNHARISHLFKRQLIGTDALSQQSTQLIRARQDVQRLMTDMQSLVLRLDGMDLREQQVRAKARAEEIRLEAELNRLKSDRKIMIAAQSYDVVAPTAGIATAVLVSNGYALTGGRQIFSILPHGGVLQVELYVPSRAIGFVEPGQSVRLLFDAFPYQRYGAQVGQVAEVTSTVITQSSAELLVQITEPVYRVTVKIDSETILAENREVPIQPGMLLNANIVLEERTILSWLLEPLLSVARRT